MRFTHHAKNKLRHLRGTTQEAEAAVKNKFAKDFDEDGNPRYGGSVAGRRCYVVVALDDPNCVITVFKEERG